MQFVRRSSGRPARDRSSASNAAADRSPDSRHRARRSRCPQFDRPLDAERGIVPSYARRQLRRVDSRSSGRALRSNRPSVWKPCATPWGMKTASRFSSSRFDCTRAEDSVGRVRPQVEQHVEDCAAQASHQLALPRRRPLEMHSSHRASTGVERHTRLHNLGRQARTRKLSRRRTSARRSPGIGDAVQSSPKARLMRCRGLRTACQRQKNSSSICRVACRYLSCFSRVKARNW